MNITEGIKETICEFSCQSTQAETSSKLQNIFMQYRTQIPCSRHRANHLLLILNPLSHHNAAEWNECLQIKNGHYTCDFSLPCDTSRAP